MPGTPVPRRDVACCVSGVLYFIFTRRNSVWRKVPAGTSESSHQCSSFKELEAAEVALIQRRMARNNLAPMQSLKEIEAAEPAIYQPRPFLGRGVIMQPSACRFVPRPSRDESAKRWVTNGKCLFLTAVGRRACRNAAGAPLKNALCLRWVNLSVTHAC